MEKFISFSNKLKPSAGWPQTFPSSKAGWLVSFVLVLLTALANPVRATDFTNNYVFISGSRGGSPIATTQYYTKATDYAGSQPFQGQVLGQGMDFNRNQSGIDELFINAEANTITTGDDNIQAVQLLYRVYRADGADEPGNQIPLNLPLQSGSPDGLGNWQYLTNKTNLINFATSPGKYVVEVAFSAAVSAAGDAADQPPTLLLDDRGGQYYKATFNVSVNGGQYITLSWNPYYQH